nr:uncharacterized protein LOC111421478 [Onthophagus taurus]
MMKLSNQKFSEVDVGATVRVPVPDVDRARGSPRNVLAVITHVEDNLYKLCTESGVLKSKYTRSQFNPCKEKLLDKDQLLHGATEKEITLREAAACASPSGSQGYQRCQCKTKCKTKKCLCKSTGILCNSKCHGSLPCENKADN